MDPPRHCRGMSLSARGSIVMILCLTWLSAVVPAASALSYVESSTGLIPPSMEGGRTELEMADMDNDGNPDLVSIGDHGSPYINTDQHGIMVWFGDGSGGWSVHQEGDFGYGGIAVGDVNGDGFLDVGYGMHHNYSSTDFGDQLIEVALNDGTGRHWIPWDDGLATNGETWGMFCTDFADIDTDGDLDLVSNSFGASAGIHVYRNQGNGTWMQSFGFVGGNSNMDIVFGDVNGDGFPDFAAAHQNGTVYLGDGSGGFTVVDGNLPGTAWSRKGQDLGDVDGDGADELSFCTSDNGVRVWRYAGGSLWEDMSGTLPSSGSFSLSQLDDMDADGHLDVAAFGGGTVKVWCGNGVGEWTEGASFPTPMPSSARAFRTGVDCDHNGYPDMAIVAEEGSWPTSVNRLRVYREASTPTESALFAVEPGPNRVLIGGSVRTIRWLSSVSAGGPGSIDLALSTWGPEGPWMPVANRVANNGCYQWLVPDGLASPRCWIRYAMTIGQRVVSCTSRGAFFIIPSAACPVPLVSASLEAGYLVLRWLPVTQASAYYVYRDSLSFFDPDTVLFSNRVAVLESLQTEFAALEGVGDPEVNTFYRITSVDQLGQELGRSAAVGEIEWAAPLPGETHR